MIRSLNSLFGFAPTLALSRVRRDAALVLSVIAVLAASVVLSVALPRLVLDAVDSGAREAVAAAGRAADIDMRLDVGSPAPGLSVVGPQTVIELADELPGRLPATLARLYPDLYVTVLSPTTPAQTDATPRITLQVGMLVPDDASTITVTDGQLPSAPRDGDRTEIDVVLSAAAAEAASVRVGDVLEFTEARADGMVAVVSGIIAPVDEASQRWNDLPQLWGPVSTDSRAVSMTVLTNVEGFAAAEPAFSGPSTATLRLVPDASAFSSALLAPVREQIGALRLDASALRGNSGADLVLRSSFDSALDEYPGRARAAMAQMLVLIAGVLGVAAAVVMMLSRLMVARRSAEVALERARGASLASIVIRSVLESALVSAVAGALGLAVATAIGGAPLTDPTVIVLILAVGVLASPVQAAVLVVSADRRARRTAANRGARREVARRGQARRLVIEGFVVVVAAAALYAVRSRGLLQTRTDGVDPLLAAAPLLMALGVSVIVLRVYPVVVRCAASLGRRSRGVLGTLGAMQAERALGVLPLAALTLAVSLIVSGGLLVETVRSGQVDASWQRTGADARVEAPLTAAEVTAVAASPGVLAASGMLALPETPASAGAQTALVTVLAVDPSFDDVLRGLPPQSGIGGDHDISALVAPVADGDPLPVLVDSRLARQWSGDLTLTVAGEGTGRDAVEVRIVGSIDSSADGYDAGPFIYIDREALGGRVDLTDDANVLLVIGPGAESAVATLDGDVFRRTQWLADQQSQALVSGVRTVMLSATGAVAVLALIGLVANVLAGSRGRRRSLSLLRTLGMGPRLGWWLALSELAPMVIAALAGGVAAGVGVIVVMAPSFGLETLAGGVQPPALTIAPWVLGAVVAGALVLGLVALLVEVVVHRRDRLSDVLRVGESL